MPKQPGTYGPGPGEAPLCNMHNRYLERGCCPSCDKLAGERHKHGETVERARIVAWMRYKSDHNYRGWSNKLADAIERGEHE